MSGQIFINYRRGDEPGFTQALLGRLEQAFPADRLFIDVDNIPPGEDFVHVLESQVAQCDTLLAVIGKGWLDATDERGSRRLDDPNDFVRIEIESALKQGKRVIPVLVHDARMPRPDELPEAIRPLARRNAVRLTHERFRSDVQGLVKALQQALREIDERQQSQAEAEAAQRAEEERRRRDLEAERRAEEEERKRLAEIEAQQLVAEERRRQETEAVQRAEAERRRQKAEAARHGEEEERKRLAEIEVKQRAVEERRRRKALAEQRAAEERAFAAARRAGTVAMIDAFLATHPAADLADEAQKLKAGLLAREEAYCRVIASDDLATLRAFRDAYKKGVDVDRVRERLRALEPAQQLGVARPAIVVPAALAVLLIGAAVIWFEMRPNTERRQISAAAAAPSAASVPAPATSGHPANGTAPETKTKLANAVPTAASPSPTVTATPTAPPGPGPDEVAWLLLKDTTDEGALKRFVGQFPDSPRRKDAEARITTLAAVEAAWNLVKDSKDPDELRRFVQVFPNSPERSTAEQRIASLAAAPPTPPVTPAVDPHELARLLQFQLQRVGCFKGAMNGEFDDATKAAWHRFIKLTSISMPDEVSSDAINNVRGINKRICPLVCPHGEHAEGELCIANPVRPPAPKRAAATAAPTSEPTPQASLPATAPVGRGCRGRGAASGNKHRLPGGGCGY